jgi:hypothetical protein
VWLELPIPVSLTAVRKTGKLLRLVGWQPSVVLNVNIGAVGGSVDPVSSPEVISKFLGKSELRERKNEGNHTHESVNRSTTSSGDGQIAARGNQSTVTVRNVASMSRKLATKLI